MRTGVRPGTSVKGTRVGVKVLDHFLAEQNQPGKWPGRSGQECDHRRLLAKDDVILTKSLTSLPNPGIQLCSIMPPPSSLWAL